MDERPENAVDVVEDMSLDLKRSILQKKQDTLRDSPSSSAAFLLAEQQKSLFTQGVNDGDHEEELVRNLKTRLQLLFRAFEVNMKMFGFAFLHVVKCPYIFTVVYSCLCNA